MSLGLPEWGGDQNGYGWAMNEYLRPVELKLARAQVQIDELRATLGRWSSANPIVGRGELSEDRMTFRLIAEASEFAPDLERFGVAIGETVHNLRSALDNLAFALARLHADPPVKPRHIAFPIFKDVASYRSSLAVASLAQLPTGAAALIEKMQPYHRDETAVEGSPETDPLVLLQELSNDDKHRIPSLALLLPREIEMHLGVEFYSDADAAENVPPVVTVWGDAIRNGVPLIEQRTNKPICRAFGTASYDAIVAVRVGNFIDPVDELMTKLHRYVGLVVAQFAPMFRA